MSSSAELVAVPSTRAHLVWPSIAHYLRPAIERSLGRHSEETVLASIVARDSQLWIVRNHGIDGAVVTQILTYPTGKKGVNVFCLGGRKTEEWFHLWDHIEEWAKQNGCVMAEMRGRKGWARKLPWTVTGIEMVKEF